MSKNKKDKDSSGSEVTQLALVAAVLSLVVFLRIWPYIRAFWFAHRLAILFSFWASVTGVLVLTTLRLWNIYVERTEQKGITAKDNTAVYLGKDCDTGDDVYLRQEFRPTHCKILGATGTGKTMGGTGPMAIKDVENGSGLLMLDGKSEASFAYQLYAYVKRFGREKDFRFFSLSNPELSWSFNPLRGASAQEVTERVFSSFKFENEYYKNLQYKIFLNLIRLVYLHEQVPTFSLIHRLLTDMTALDPWVATCPSDVVKHELVRFMKLSEREREEKISGLDSLLGHFTSDEMAPLFEETDNAIDIEEAMEHGHIVYFQLPTMYYPVQAEATGKLVLQCLQSAVSKRQFKMAV
jgi:hypothetical protein